MIQRCTKSCNIQSRNLKSFEDSNEISLKALEENFRTPNSTQPFCTELQYFPKKTQIKVQK